MRNGASAALQLIAPEIPASRPCDERFGAAEGWVGPIMSAVAYTSIQAVRELQTGKIDPATRMQGGDLIARLVVIREEMGERAFATAAHRLPDGPVYHGTPLDAELVDDILAAVARVAGRVREMN